MNEAAKQKIEAIKTNPATVNINFTNEELGDDGAALLAEALQGRQLTHLYLVNCKITNEGFKSLLPVINACTNLIVLDLSDQDLDFSAITITSLKNIGLKNCNINNDKLPALKNIFNNNKGLHTINLNSNPLNPEIMEEVAKVDWKNLSVQSCNLTLDACKGLTNYSRRPNYNPSNFCQGNQFTRVDWEAKVFWSINEKQLNEVLEVKMKEMQAFFEQKLEAQKKEIEIAFDQKLLNMSKENQAIIDQLNSKFLSLGEKLSELETNLINTSSRIKSGTEFINDILFIASKSGNYQLAKLALEIGADLKAIDPETGETALSLTLSNGYRNIAEMFRELKPEVITYPNRDGNTPIVATLINYNIAKEDQLAWLCAAEKINKPKEEEREPDYKKYYELSPFFESKYFLATDKLWESVKSGNLNGIKDVLDNNELNIDVNMIREKDKETLLYQVVYYNCDNSVEMARYLVSKGADYNLKCHVFETSESLSEEQFEKLSRSIVSVTNLDANTDGELLKDAEIVNKYNNQSGDSPYDRARIQKNKEMIKLFGSHSICKSIRCDNEKAMESALIIAQDNLRDDSASLLAVLDFDNQTALHLAALNPNKTFMETLLKIIPNKDISLEVKNAEGKTALHLAIENQNLEIVKLLLNKGASIEAKDNLEQVPLHKAVSSFKDDKSSMDIIKEVLRKHAAHNSPIKVKDINNELPSDIATRQKHSDLANDLGEKFGAYKQKLKNNSITSQPNSSIFTTAITSTATIASTTDKELEEKMRLNAFF